MFKKESEYLPFLEADKKGFSEWSSPSNIALIKYWGKRTGQIPENPSLSFSLENSRTITRVDYRVKKEKGIQWSFLFEGSEAPGFRPKLELFINSLIPYLPFLEYLELKIESSNTFPHSTGIASSASSMSALSLCLLDIDSELTGIKEDTPVFFQKASFLARMGSGSASRSVFPGFSVWGKTNKVKASSDDFAVSMELPEGSFFNDLADAILIVSTEKKEISSSTGHKLMHSNPYSQQRYITAEKNLVDLLRAIKTEDRGELIRLIENEALGLHGLMMTSDPGYILMKGSSIEIIQKIRKFREETGTFITFTLDAGPNVHLLYNRKDHSVVADFINKELLKFTEEGRIIWDFIGSGPQKINS